MDKTFGFNFARTLVVLIVFLFQVIQFVYLFSSQAVQSNIVYLLPTLSILAGYILDTFCIRDSIKAQIIENFALKVLYVNLVVVAIIFFYMFMCAVNEQADFVVLGYIVAGATLFAIGLYGVLCFLALKYAHNREVT